MTTFIFDVSFGCIGINAVSEAEARLKGKALGVVETSILADAIDWNDPLYDDMVKAYGCKVY